MFVYTAVHIAPVVGCPEPLTTCVSPSPLSPQAVADLAFARAAIPLQKLCEYPLEYPAVDSDPTIAMTQVMQRYEGCARCHLSESRTKIVHYRGNIYAPIVCIGEGPGKDEDLRGLPFIGRSGRLQDQLFKESGLDPEQHMSWINIVACRPCASRFDEDRKPSIVEKTACSERLLMTLRAIKPRVVLCMGEVSAGIFFPKDEEPPPNTWTTFPGPAHAPDDWIAVGVIRHPAYLLRVIAAPNTYKEYKGAMLFYEKLRAIIPTLTKPSAWHFGLKFLAEITQPMVEGRP